MTKLVELELPGSVSEVRKVTLTGLNILCVAPDSLVLVLTTNVSHMSRTRQTESV